MQINQTISIDELLRNNIRELGYLLGEVLIEQESKDLFNKVEKLRALTKEMRLKPREEIRKRIKKIITGLGVEESYNIVKAFSVYFILVNAADEVSHILNRKRPADPASTGEVHLQSAFEELMQLRPSARTIATVLSTIRIIPVFTAHPTEATRQTILKKIYKISQFLLIRELQYHTDTEKQKIKEEIKTSITLLWQSNEIRFHKVTVNDEIFRGLFFFKNVFYHILPDFYAALSQRFGKMLNYHKPLPAMLKFGSWIGGDRDGHPFVTEELTRQTLRLHREEILRLYMQELNGIYEELSTSALIKGASLTLQQSIISEQAVLKIPPTDYKLRESTEVYRAKLYLIHKRLENTLTGTALGYVDASAFRADLMLMVESLQENDGELIIRNILTPFIQKVDTFGFHFVRLDIRQNARLIKEAAIEILDTALPEANYPNMDENEKIRFLTREILNPRPLTNAFSNLSEPTLKVINELALIRFAHLHISAEAADDYIISNCASASDVLQVLLLATEVGLITVEHDRLIDSQLNILPLFETIGDLRNSKNIMTQLYSNPVYIQQLQLRKGVQKIMLGYSDSNKDGGIVTSNFELYTAQIRLSDISVKYKINLEIFHGRGGSISRGGGPVYESILAQPENTINGRLKITEQGEMISSKYLMPDNAINNLAAITSAVLLKTFRQAKKPASRQYDAFIRKFEPVSQFAFEQYRSLLEHGHFLEYFRSVTPIDIIEKIEIGSRPPARRNRHEINALRAIPWVFSWTQNRQTISGWYGFGYAIDKALGSAQLSLEDLQEMYQRWPFFTTLIQNIEMVLMKTDMMIAAEYLALNDKPYIREIFSLIGEEYERSVANLLKITGENELLEKNPILKRTLLLRNPYLDPINYIQVELIDKYRRKGVSQSEKRELLHVLRSSVNGIAAGIRNTG